MRSLRSPNMDKRDSNKGWTSEPGDEEITIRNVDALNNIMVTNQEKSSVVLNAELEWALGRV